MARKKAAKSSPASFAEPDDFEVDDVTDLNADEEREVLGWLQDDEKQHWEESKVTRRRVIPTLLRRLALERRAKAS